MEQYLKGINWNILALHQSRYYFVPNFKKRNSLDIIFYSSDNKIFKHKLLREELIIRVYNSLPLANSNLTKKEMKLI